MFGGGFTAVLVVRGFPWHLVAISTWYNRNKIERWWLFHGVFPVILP